LSRHGKAASLTVQGQFSGGPLELGESIADNGTCLTVESFTDGSVVFHTLAETLSRTNLGQLSKGSRVNLERALRLGDRLGGHVVSGHIDGTASVLSIGKSGDDIALTVALPADLACFAVMKGSIAINGVSLTIAKLGEDFVQVCIIPHTWSHTNLSTLKEGDLVNLEMDLFGKYVLRSQEVAAKSKHEITMNTLVEAGFLN